MFFHNKRLYRTALNAKNGRDRSPKLLRDLKAWIENKYSISVVLLKYSTINIGPQAGRPSLNVIVETDRDYDAIHKDWLTLKPSVNAAISKQFALMIAETDSSSYSADAVHITTDNFSEEAMRISTAEFLEAELESTVDRFAEQGLWTLTAMSREIVAFFFSDNQKDAAKQNGCFELLTDHCFERIAQYDPFRYFKRPCFPIRMDSKENFDKNYQGNWYYYFK